MSAEKRTEYLWSQILLHLNLFFDRQTIATVDRSRILFGPYAAVTLERRPVIAIPNDIPYNMAAKDAYAAPFGETHLTLWNRLEIPPGDGWRALPDNAAPVWYVHASGTHLPAWNLFGNLFALLTSQEEREFATRDKHGRFAGGRSPRAERGLMEVPAFNEAVAALAAACVGLSHEGQAELSVRGLVKPPVVVLSHDCDILRGNDRWTQAIRFARIFLPLAHLRPPRIANLWWIARNYIRPDDFYFDNVLGMVNLERQFGFTSTFYLLNGTPGRYGARSGSWLLPKLIAAIPPGWSRGIHYNYDTFLDTIRFVQQMQELTDLLGGRPRFGRAHYLRFDMERSPEFLAAQGIKCDESAGFSDRIAYRCGIAGCFQPYDPATESAVNILELPMMIMEDALKLQYGDGAAAVFEQMLRHLGQIGGALTLNVHPGVFHNPEIPRMLGFYHRLLCLCRDLGVRGMAADDLIGTIPPEHRVRELIPVD
ncbi:hypothetical protein C3F09_05845 [candidate division GN15 bacterium]|uniref:Uncharacterized protein n=1 Tax=candidate division GN15 bacterium TaxID=2072418 RepID=A0A855X426_9BACT|nr:MAG: hypothetical protein C3F09_05845 [candidate division GN15 bacterium]